MKTHDLAKALNHLARVLRAGPNIDFEELVNFSTYVSSGRSNKLAPVKTNERSISEKGAGLALLAQMANYNKQELMELAEVLDIPIEVRKADAVRDVLGKILRSINENPQIQDRLRHGDTSNLPNETSALARALTILMSQS
jgi:hypothetical protein